MSCVPEGRVQEPADPRARVLRRVLGRLADEPGKRDERDRGEHELRRLREIGGVVEDDDERRSASVPKRIRRTTACGTLVGRTSSVAIA